jgi:hypothetical protein
MDYKAFYDDVWAWIGKVNQAATHYRGMGNPDFWSWVAQSSSSICEKYQNHRLAIKQMIMLVEWLEEVYDERRKAP